MRAALTLAVAACTTPPPKPTAPPPPAPAAVAPDVTLRFDIMQADRVAGHAVLVRHPDGALDEDYEFNDRGRGPKTHARVALGADGRPDRVDIAGKDYFKRDVHEVLACTQTNCKWDSDDEHGEAARAFFRPLNLTLALDAPMLKLAMQPSGVALLGGGTEHARKVGETTLVGHLDVIHVEAWELSGLAFTPAIEWFDDTGAVFALLDDWGGAIRDGWGDSRERLVATQRELLQTRLEQLAKASAHRAGKLAIVHARLFDPATKKVTDDATIIVEAGVIKTVRAKLAPPKDALVIDAAGKFVMPGLWDMHGHVSDADGILEIANGVTTVRDLGNDMTGILKRKAHWDAGTELGPHLLLAGLVDGRGPFQAPTGIFVDTEDEAKQAIATLVDKGYVQLKIYSSTKPELVPLLVKEAHAKGLRVSGHVPAHMIAEDAINAGFDELQHVNFLMLDVLATREEDTRGPMRFMRVAEKAADVDLDGPKAKALVDLLVAKHVVVDPTLAIFEEMFTVRPDHPAPALAPVLARLPSQVRRAATTGALPVPDGMDGRYKASFARCVQLVKRLWDRKVTIVAGTDSIPGFTLHRELEIYAEAGIPNAEVLAIATLGAAKVMRADKTTGSIAPGKAGDIAIIDGDPLARMTDIRKVATVIKGDLVVDALEAQQALSIAKP
jgi:imidazolonepropionase-like amidohydrolase